MPSEFPSPQDSNEDDKLWETLFSLVPESGKLPKNQRKAFMGLMRQHLVHEQEDEAAALNVFRLDDPAPLKALVDALPVFTYEEVVDRVKELNLSREESETEVAHWAMRHQSAKGQFLIGERLVPFRIVRLQEHAYLLISLEIRDEISKVFSEIFGREPGAFSGKALYVEDQTWTGWAWFIDPDRREADAAAAKLRETWKGMQ